MKPSGYFDVYEGNDGTPSYVQIKPKLADKTSVKLYSAADINAWLMEPVTEEMWQVGMNTEGGTDDKYRAMLAAKLEELK
jgi:hypothetical protein